MVVWKWMSLHGLIWVSRTYRDFCGVINYVSRPCWCLRDTKLLVLWWAVVSTWTFIHACDPHAGPGTWPCEPHSLWFLLLRSLYSLLSPEHDTSVGVGAWLWWGQVIQSRFWTGNWFGMFGGSPWLTPSGIAEKTDQLVLIYYEVIWWICSFLPPSAQTFSGSHLLVLGLQEWWEEGFTVLWWDSHRAASQGSTHFSPMVSWQNVTCPHPLVSFDNFHKYFKYLWILVISLNLYSVEVHILENDYIYFWHKFTVFSLQLHRYFPDDVNPMGIKNLPAISLLFLITYSDFF